MSQENVEIVRRIYEGWAAGDLNAGAANLDPHVMFVVRPSFPEFGVFVGAEGIRNYLRRFLEQWERISIEATELKAVGDTVLARVIQHSKGKVSGIEGENRFFMLFTFRAGKIVRIESVIEEEDALKAAGLAE